MAITLGLLPEWVRADGRYGYSGFDANSNLYVGPISQNGPQYTAQASGGWASATQVFTDPNRSYSTATASWNILSVSYDDINYFFPSDIAVKVPNFITAMATIAGWGIA